jgi:signal transduction histidine kinase
MNDQARFVSDASHELRTPLTAIAMENEVILRDKTVGKKELHTQVKSNLEEVKKLQKLSDTLLQISQSDKVDDPKEHELVLEQIIKILVENAVKYDPKHCPPKIERSEKEIKVCDQGTGIAEKDLPHIFDRFYRAEKSRTSSGFGLGLSLAQHLAHKIGAEIVAENNRGGGATFTVRF